MKNLLTKIVRNMVDYPNLVLVRETREKGKVLFELSVARSDVGKIIGRDGRNIKAIRWIMKSAAAKTDLFVAVEVVEVQGVARTFSPHETPGRFAGLGTV